MNVNAKENAVARILQGIAYINFFCGVILSFVVASMVSPFTQVQYGFRGLIVVIALTIVVSVLLYAFGGCTGYHFWKVVHQKKA